MKHKLNYYPFRITNGQWLLNFKSFPQKEQPMNEDILSLRHKLSPRLYLHHLLDSGYAVRVRGSVIKKVKIQSIVDGVVTNESTEKVQFTLQDLVNGNYEPNRYFHMNGIDDEDLKDFEIFEMPDMLKKNSQPLKCQSDCE